MGRCQTFPASYQYYFYFICALEDFGVGEEEINLHLEVKIDLGFLGNCE